MKRIVWEHPDGSIEISQVTLGPLLNENGDVIPETDAEYLDRGEAKFRANTPHLALLARKTDIETADIPNHLFRAAWRDGDGNVVIDMPLARVIHEGRMVAAETAERRALRDAIDDAEDDNDPTERAQLLAKRKSLRGVARGLDLSGAKTPEELDALWPAELSARAK